MQGCFDGLLAPSLAEIQCAALALYEVQAAMAREAEAIGMDAQTLAHVDWMVQHASSGQVDDLAPAPMAEPAEAFSVEEMAEMESSTEEDESE